MPGTITITMLYFAMFRERLGTSQAELTIPVGTAVDDVFDLVVAGHPELHAMRKSTMVMVNEEYSEPSQLLQDGDEVALIPPVSGGAQRFICTPNALNPREIESLVASADCGALVTFAGTVRNHARGLQVKSLEYEAYAAAAERMLAKVGDEVQEQWPEVRIAIAHRYGHLLPGDTSVVICTSSAHRDVAYAANAWAIDRIKQIVPIWKKEYYADGSVWVGSEHDYQVEIGRLATE